MQNREYPIALANIGKVALAHGIDAHRRSRNVQQERKSAGATSTVQEFHLDCLARGANSEFKDGERHQHQPYLYLTGCYRVVMRNVHMSSILACVRISPTALPAALTRDG